MPMNVPWGGLTTRCSTLRVEPNPARRVVISHVNSPSRFLAYLHRSRRHR